MCVDFEKAFDSVSLDFLSVAMKKFNFGPSFRKWICTFYTNRSSCIMNKGVSSGYLEKKRGVRQGGSFISILIYIDHRIINKGYK